MIYLAISSILIVALLVFYPKAWRFVEGKKEDDSDLSEKDIELSNNYDGYIKNFVIYYFDGRPSEPWNFHFDTTLTEMNKHSGEQNRIMISGSSPQYLASYKKRPLKNRVMNAYRNIIGVFCRKKKNTPI